VPGLWARLADVPEILVRRFGVDTSMLEGFRHLLLSEVLADKPAIEHRVAGRRSRFDTSRPFMERLQFARSASGYWTSIGFDPATGTAQGGPDIADQIDQLLGVYPDAPQPAVGVSADAARKPARVHVEVYLPSIYRWYEQVGREQLRAQHSLTTAPDAPESPAPTAEAVQPSVVNKGKYSREALSAWYVIRVHTWPDGKPGPNEEEDLRDARAAFDRVPRDTLRKVRGAKAPEAWKKPGPGRGH
jgi:hypothetical protein